MKNTNPKIDAFLNRAEQWQEESTALRKIILDFPLTEDMKWGKPCYALGTANLVLIQGFKEYCALLFFKGTLLKDAKKLLSRIGENTQAGRQLRFTSTREITAMKSVIKAYLEEAIAVEKAGLKVEFKESKDFPIPDEFQLRLKQNAALKAGYDKLTPGRQRAYLLFFSSAKQSKTREARIDKWQKQITAGKGMDD